MKKKKGYNIHYFVVCAFVFVPPVASAATYTNTNKSIYWTASQVRSECLTCTFIASCGSARLSWSGQVGVFNVHIQSKLW